MILCSTEEDPCECKSIVKFQTKVEELIDSLQRKYILWKLSLFRTKWVGLGFLEGSVGKAYTCGKQLRYVVRKLGSETLVF